MTSLSLEEVRECFTDNITIWGGLPSICVLEDSMDDMEFNRYIDQFFKDISDRKKIILSFADTTPPAARFDRIEMVARIAKDF
jgi:hypothetical protein